MLAAAGVLLAACGSGSSPGSASGSSDQGSADGAKVAPANFLALPAIQLGGLTYRSLGANAYLSTGTDEVTIERTAFAQTVTDNGTTTKAPPDSKYLVAQLHASALGQDSGSASTAPASAALVGGATQNVDGLGNLTSGLNSQTQTATLVLTVPNKASAQLSLSQDGLTQAISLTDGQRTPGDPAVFYRNDTVQVGQTYSLPFAVIPPPGEIYFRSFPYGSSPPEITVNSATLSWSVQQHPASNPSMAWLTLDTNVTDGDDWSGAVSPSNMVLTLPGGRQIPATVFNPDPSVAIFGGTAAWEVPASFTDGTLTIVPGNILNTNGTGFAGTRLDYQNAKATIPIHITM